MDQVSHEAAAMDRLKRHPFIGLIIGAIGVSIFLVFVALSLYQTSGTVQLDLSRPGYAEARREAIKDGSRAFVGFSADGPINKAALDDFERMYEKEMKDATSVNAYSGDALSDGALQLSGN